MSSVKLPIARTRVRDGVNHCVKKIKWKKEEDELLAQVMSETERPTYPILAQLFPGKTGQQVAERWDKVLNPALTKGSWTRLEDETIVEFVKKNGTKKWKELCYLLPGRIGKQCRERWRHHLDPAINHAPWTQEEDIQLVQLHKELGNAWVKIANRMRNRSDNAVKNRWNSTLRKTEGGVSSTFDLNSAEETPPNSSPFISIHAPLKLVSPVLAAGKLRDGSETKFCSLEQNRMELQRLMMD
jgi:hypothetical protein